jgi:hypothetical protein
MAFSNTVEYALKYLDMLDRVYKAGSVTSVLEPAANLYKFDSANEKTVYIKTITAEGLGTYNRSTGYDDGDLTIAWAAHTFSQDRGKRFLLDTQDEKEAYTQMAEVGAEFQRVYVNSELDAYRFEVLCTNAGNTVTAALTYDDVIAAIRTGIQTLDNAEVPQEQRILFVSAAIQQAMEDSGEFFKTINVTQNNGTIDTTIKTFNNMPVIPVPSGRFYNDFDFSATNGYSVAAGGDALNFVIVYKPAAMAIVKYKTSNIIDAAANQTADGYILKYRIYHDCFCPANKVNGIYVHKAT